MKISIIYSSKTNNTKFLATCLKEHFSNQEIVYFGTPKDKYEDADIYFIGSWTDKGNASIEILNTLSSLKNKNIAYFGTAGFGFSNKYFEQLFARISKSIDPSNKVLGQFFCQGKMSISVKNRYLLLLQEDPDSEKLHTLIDNFDKAWLHPNNEDKANLLAWADKIISK